MVVVCIFLFGNTDDKRSLLQEVGLDYSQSKYEEKKEAEFKKSCCKAMTEAIDKYDIIGDNESMFLDNLYKILCKCNTDIWYEDMYGEHYSQRSPYSVSVSKPFLGHAKTIICRRCRDLEEEGRKPLLQSCDFKYKSDLKKYVKQLWEYYHEPMPREWVEKVKRLENQ